MFLVSTISESSLGLTWAQEYFDALANIGEPVKEKDLVMLVISGLREEYNGLKSALLGRQFTTAFEELHGLLSDHDYMIKKPATDISPAQAFIVVTNSHTSVVHDATSSTPPTVTPQNQERRKRSGAEDVMYSITTMKSSEQATTSSIALII
uniref:Uncharacterized protein n=1 Tax=Lactuca sativa TaxID=4236 RepID=A0A9R1UUD8_LACSA|nr:hypothetical protein LSAT_V11C800407230 [Lactuca sativa]